MDIYQLKGSDPEKRIALDSVNQDIAEKPGHASSEAVRLDQHGRILRPTPSSSPLDPLNWSKWKKNGALFVVAAYFFIFSFLTSVTVPTFAQLQEKFNISYAQVNYTVAIPALGLAVGHLIFSPFAQIYGRRIVMIVSCVIALVASIGSGAAKTYGGYMAARTLQGIGVSPASTVGLTIINDMFFEHERGQKVGMWCLAIDLGLVIGPLPGGYISLITVDWPAWLTAILFAIVLALMILMLPESMYEREEIADAIRPEKKVPFLNIRPLTTRKTFKPWSALIAFFSTFRRLPVVIIVFYYGYTFYWWILTAITMQPAAYEEYSAATQGLLFIGLLIGTLFAEIFLSGTLSDRLVAHLAGRNGGIRTPEQRLWLIYPASLLTFAGLTLWGWAVQEGYHWSVSQVGLALLGAGIQQSNTMVTSYMVDSYPDHVMDCVTFYTVLLNISAFISPFFAAAWQERSGFGWSFTARIIALVATFIVVPFLSFMGPAIRSR